MESRATLADVLTTISHCFASVDRDVWEAEAAFGAWTGFLSGCSAALTPVEGRACVLENWLSQPEVDALKNPPTFAQKNAFAAHHFTGGLPGSAVPVESLYRPWATRASAAPMAGRTGFYGGDSAAYMKNLIERMGMKVPREFAACPDHLALEADMAALLLRAGGEEQAREFVVERFAWLTSYRLKLLSLGDEAHFYVALVDVLSGLASRWTPEEGAESA